MLQDDFEALDTLPHEWINEAAALINDHESRLASGPVPDDTSGATLSELEDEVNALKALLRLLLPA
jgi:hypothetical protein